MIIDRFEREG